MFFKSLSAAVGCFIVLGVSDKNVGFIGIVAFFGNAKACHCCMLDKFSLTSFILRPSSAHHFRDGHI